MVILVLLQNQWFNEPERVKEMYREHPEHRNRFVANFLFMGCLTGKRLQEAWGEDLCDQLIWEEASPEIAGKASASPPADPAHIMKAISDVKPDVMVTLGTTATNGLIACTAQYGRESYKDCELTIITREPPLSITVLTGPHPTSRHSPMPRLREIGERLRALLAQDESLPLLDDEEALPLGD